MTIRISLLSLLLALPAEAQEKDCDKAKMTCAEGSTYDAATKTCVKVSS